ncbi:Snf7-domain-containing protein [Dipodascopsis uninucleata]
MVWSTLFGSGGSTSSRNANDAKSVILALRTQLELLEKKEKHIEQQIEEQDKLARKNIATNKLVAKKALRQKKLLEGGLLKLQAQIDTLTSQTNSIESANLNLETMRVMQQGAKAMKQIHGTMNIDRVDETMDEIREQISVAEEIGDAIAQPLGQEEYDIEDELEELEQAALDEKMLKAGTVPTDKVSAVNMSTPAAKEEDEEEDEEEELRKLQREMAL